MELIIGLLLAVSVLIVISLQRAYSHLPLKELRRRAQANDETAVLLHQAATYGISLHVLLWFLIGLTAAGFFVFMARRSDTLVALVLSAGLVWGGFIWLPKKEVKQISLWFAKTLAPAIAWLLQYLHTPISWLAGLLNLRSSAVHTGLFDKEDLLELLNSQNIQADNRIEEQELALAFHALTFGDKKVEDHMTPRRSAKSVGLNDDIGPVLMDELHASGMSRFPVYDGKKDNIVGTLYLRDLVKTKGSSKVKDVLRPEVCYIHEDQTLYDALQAILKTRHHQLIVVNSFEEYVGIISMEDVLEQIVGLPIHDEFDQYDDRKAVAQRLAHKATPTEAPAPSEEPTEVIE